MFKLIKLRQNGKITVKTHFISLNFRLLLTEKENIKTAST